MNNRLWYYTTSLVSGYIILSLELLGFRLLAPYFGYSLYVFGSLIGLVLLALALGYWLGGWWGDSGVGTQTVFGAVLAAGAYLLIVGLFSGRLLTSFAKFSIVTGSLFSVFVLFAPPMVVLAALSPYLIKILAGENGQGVGVSAGSVYAISTIGSLLGTFLTSFYLVPTFGTFTTLLLNGAFTLCLGVAWLVKKKMALAAFAVIVFAFAGSRKEMSLPTVIAQTESPYNHLEVVDFGNFLGLRTDRRNKLIFSHYPKGGRWSYQFLLYDLFAVPPLLNGARAGLLLGLGAGSIPLLHEQVNPGLVVTGVEIDPKIIELGKSYFGLDKIHALENIIIADVRPFLARNKNRYDVIDVDLFWGSGELPFYLATKEFFGLARTHLTDAGILAMNIFDPSDDRKILAPLLNTIASVYRYTYLIPVHLGSHFVVASDREITGVQLENALSGTNDPNLANVVKHFKDNFHRVAFAPAEAVFTDDWAPLERLSYEAIFRDQ